MSGIRDLREATGASHEQIAEALTMSLGRPISPATVRNNEAKHRFPKSWRQALGVDSESTPAGAGATSQGPASVREGEPPRPPDGPRQPDPTPAAAPGDYSAVRDRIAKAYGAIGAGASMVTRNQGYAAVADAYSHDLARAWEAAAKENANVRRIVEFMESGGPVGELVVAHIILVGGFVYVSGRGEAFGFLFEGKFGSFHNAAAAARQLADAEAELLNGSAPVDPASFMGEPQG